MQTSNQNVALAFCKSLLIQGFEYTHELSWNVLRDFFRDQGFQNLHGSKDAVRKAFSEGLITDGQVWMDMILDRNRTSHTYNHEVAEKITHNICKVYCDQFLKLEAALQELIDADNERYQNPGQELDLRQAAYRR
jgi:nucleotidyltransferase substrate binding protein (TIGR01987 family)